MSDRDSSAIEQIDGIRFLIVLVSILIGEGIGSIYAGSRPLPPEPSTYLCRRENLDPRVHVLVLVMIRPFAQGKGCIEFRRMVTAPIAID